MALELCADDRLDEFDSPFCRVCGDLECERPLCDACGWAHAQVVDGEATALCRECHEHEVTLPAQTIPAPPPFEVLS